VFEQRIQVAPDPKQSNRVVSSPDSRQGEGPAAGGAQGLIFALEGRRQTGGLIAGRPNHPAIDQKAVKGDLNRGWWRYA
jgi:hypothetical protein